MYLRENLIFPFLQGFQLQSLVTPENRRTKPTEGVHTRVAKTTNKPEPSSTLATAAVRTRAIESLISSVIIFSSVARPFSTLLLNPRTFGGSRPWG